MASNPPNATIYIKNLNDKVNKEELRSQLYALFATYGKVIDVVALKGNKMKGQAFLVFTNLADATTALRACEGLVFYDKPMHIDYAKEKSYATLQREDPNFVKPNAAHPKRVLPNEKITVSSADKRPREDDSMDAGPIPKREKTDDDDASDDEEMEIEDEDEPGVTSELLCTNLPPEVSVKVLTPLFEQYKGFKSIKVEASPTPNAAGEKVKQAHATFESPSTASAARSKLNGYTLKPGWVMPVAFV